MTCDETPHVFAEALDATCRGMTNEEIQALAHEAIRAALQHIALEVGVEPRCDEDMHEALVLAFDNCVRGALIVKGQRTVR